jgi:hypothetical protein
MLPSRNSRYRDPIRSIRHVVEPSRSRTQRSRSAVSKVDGRRIGPPISTALELLLLLLPLQIRTLGVAGAIALLRIVNVLVMILRWGLRLLLQICPSCPAQRLQVQRLSSGRRDSQSLSESFGLSDLLWNALERRGLLTSKRFARIQHMTRLLTRSKVPQLTLPVRSIQSIVIEGSNDPVLPFFTVCRKFRFSYWTGGSDPAREKTIELAPAAE